MSIVSFALHLKSISCKENNKDQTTRRNTFHKIYLECEIKLIMHQKQKKDFFQLILRNE